MWAVEEYQWWSIISTMCICDKEHKCISWDSGLKWAHVILIGIDKTCYPHETWNNKHNIAVGVFLKDGWFELRLATNDWDWVAADVVASVLL